MMMSLPLWWLEDLYSTVVNVGCPLSWVVTRMRITQRGVALTLILEVTLVLEVLLDYLMSTNLVWCNRGHKFTFVTRSRRKVLDLTLVSSDIVDLVSGWDVSDISSMSDHYLIKYSLRGEAELPEMRPIKQTNWESFRLSLASTIGNLKVEVGTEVPTYMIDSDCQLINEALITAFHSACPLRAGFSTKRTCAW